jgi:hypothetical protein
MIFEKRGRWCYRDDSGKLRKFNTEEEAKISAGWIPPVPEELEEPEEPEELEDYDYEEEED